MRSKRLLLLVAALSAVAVISGACAQEGGGQAGGCSSEDLQALQVSRPELAKDFTLAKAVRPSNVLGQAKKTVKIGFLGDLTGANSNLVVSSNRAAQLAVEQANAKGDLPVTLELRSEDNKDGGPDPAPGLAQRLISDPAVLGVIGPAFSGETKVTGALFEQAGLTAISQSATNPDLTKNGWKTFFRALATDDVQGGQTGTLIVDVLGCKKVAVINDKSEYGAGLGKAVVDSVKREGGDVVLDEGIEPTTDYTSVIDSVIAADADLVHYSGYVAQAPLVAKQYRDKGGEGLFMGGDGDKGAAFITEGADAAEGAVLTCPCLDPNASDAPDAQKFAADYKAKFGSEADIYSAEGWDVAQIFIAAIRAGGANATRASVLEFVTNLKDFKGLTKTFNWTPEHEVVGGEITYVYVVRDGSFKLAGTIDELAKE
ncbi:MAG TPA: branched-chain amino acid ABC transporter substrate-binding protein [Actinomycetota bacterium]|nr:branched-chain amino acid ABC transporter substrate-binding protein [Actinomycetota bacterium]